MPQLTHTLLLGKPHLKQNLAPSMKAVPQPRQSTCKAGVFSPFEVEERPRVVAEVAAGIVVDRDGDGVTSAAGVVRADATGVSTGSRLKLRSMLMTSPPQLAAPCRVAFATSVRVAANFAVDARALARFETLWLRW